MNKTLNDICTEECRRFVWEISTRDLGQAMNAFLSTKTHVALSDRIPFSLPPNPHDPLFPGCLSVPGNLAGHPLAVNVIPESAAPHYPDPDSFVHAHADRDH